MLYRCLELVAINLINEVDFLQVLRTWLQCFLVSNDVSVIRRCISHINIEVDCSLWLARLDVVRMPEIPCSYTLWS
jgi:hypothetical protein